MENTFDKTALTTIDLLEARLRRIEYAVNGHTEASTSSTGTTTQRLQSLEHGLHQLASKSRVVQDLLKLHSKHPDLFQTIPSHEIPTTLDTENILSIVLSSASAYPSTASRLTSILDVPIPPANASTQLIELQPRIAKVETIQAAQSADIAELREKTAAVLQQWYTKDVLQTGDDWANLEGRVEQVERRIRRVAAARQVDDL